MGKELDWNCFGKISAYGDEDGANGVFFIKKVGGKKDKKLVMIKNHPDISWRDTKKKAEEYKGRCVKVATSHGHDPEIFFCDIELCDSESCDC